MNLNLGSNDKKYPGYLNVDIRDIPGVVDIVDDVFVLSSIEDNTVDSIIAHNIFEHIASDRALPCLSGWVRKLKIGGKIEIGVPDGELIISRHIEKKCTRACYANNPWENVIHSIFGNMKLLRKWHGDDAEKYMHHTLYCRSYLAHLMTLSGLHEIKKTKSNHRDNITLIGWKK